MREILEGLFIAAATGLLITLSAVLVVLTIQIVRNQNDDKEDGDDKRKVA